MGDGKIINNNFKLFKERREVKGKCG